MSRSAAEDSGFNAFHSLAALGQSKLALKTISSTPKKVVTTGLSARDKKGRTPLHLAAYYGHIKVLKIFMDFSPEASEIRDSDGNNVRDALRRPEAPVTGDPEDQRCFRRMVSIDRKDCHYEDFGLGPMDVWDASVRSNATVAVMQPSWRENSTRMLYSSTKGVHQHFELDEGDVPRYVATSNLHSLVVTSDRCYAWGKNVNGVLGLDIEEKIITEPQALDKSFAESARKDDMNAFSALEGRGTLSENIKDPLIGVDCCDFYSLCYTTTKIWAWGANRGQMVNKAFNDSIVETPLLIYQSSIRIRTVKCCDSAIVVLLSDGTVLLLSGGKVSRLQSGGRFAQDIDSMAAGGSYVVLLTTQGKLLRYLLNPSSEARGEVQTLWTPRRKKDDIVSFDVGDNGFVILSTNSSVFKIEEDREIKEFGSLRGMALTSVKTDSQFRSFLGVNSIVAGLGSNNFEKRSANDTVQWGCDEHPVSASSGDLVLSCNGETLRTYKALLFARCPTLRPLLIDDFDQNVVAVPGGSTVFRRTKVDDAILVEHSFLESVEAFLTKLYFARDAPQSKATVNMKVGPGLHEFNAMMRLCTKDLGSGMWDARLSGIGCDVELDGPRFAHSSILASASPVLAAQLTRWSNGKLQDPALNEATVDDVLRHAYTHEISATAVQCSEQEKAQKLLEIWQAADELLMPKLSRFCETKLFQMLNLSLVTSFLHATSSHETQLFRSLLDVTVRNISYFVASIGDYETDMLESIEKAYKGLPGTQPVDKDLADAFPTLQSQLSASTTPNGGKKAKVITSSSPKSFTPNPGSASQASLRPDLPKQAGTQQSIVSPVKTPTIIPLSAGGGREGGWIQSRRKSRNGSLNSPEARVEALTALKPSMEKGLASSTPPLPSVKTMPQVSKRAVSSGHHFPSPQPGPSNQRENISSPLSTSRTPALGQSLPTLGSKPRTVSNLRGPRPKLSLKGNKSTQQFEDPARFAESLERANSSGTPMGTPWKQVPQAVQTSQALIERLERAQQSNSRRVCGGSVWNV